MMRQYAAPSDFLANAESGLIFPNLRNALYKGTTVANDATAKKNEFNRAVDSTITGTITYTADSAALSGSGTTPKNINTGIVVTGDCLAYVLTQKTGVVGLFGSSLAASNSSILGFNGTTTDIQFLNTNSSGSSAKILWPADIGTKKLFAAGWGRVHGFPFMVVGLNGVLSAVASGTVAGTDRLVSAGDGIFYFARPNGGGGAAITTMGAIFGRVGEEDELLAEILTAYLNARLQYPGTVY